MGNPHLTSRVLEELRKEPGLTDAEITGRLASLGTSRPTVNAVLHRLERQGRVIRRPCRDGLIRSSLTAGGPTSVEASRTLAGDRPVRTDMSANALSEDEVKGALARWLRAQGWVAEVKLGRAHGVDIEARRAGRIWRIEVKGCGSRQAMRVQYFLSTLGEILQRMDDQAARYSIAFPDMQQFRRLWERLPPLAKERTGVTALFVGADGTVCSAGD